MLDLSLDANTIYWLCNAFEWYTVKYLTSHLYFLACARVFYQDDEWDILQLYHEKGLHIFYFKLFHRKYIGQIGRMGVIQLNCTDRWEGSVPYWWIYNSFPAFWLVVFSMAWYIPCRIYGITQWPDEKDRCDTFELHWSMKRIRWNTDEYTTVFLRSYWLYFLRHGINTSY